MRTRSSGAASPEPLEPPKTTRRKRDSGVYLCDDDLDIQFSNATNTGLPSPPDSTKKVEYAPKTPSKKTKRVRFSDPGPAMSESSPNTASTGLTPFMRRTTMLSPSTRRITSPRPHPRRRASLPASLRHEPYPRFSTNVDQLSFTPYRQVLDERLKRRLRRNNMSEEFNTVNADYRATDQAFRELIKLRKESVAKEKRINELVYELESQRQLGIQVNSEEQAMLGDLRQELGKLRDAVNAKQEIVSSFHSNAASETDYGTEVDFGFESIPYVGSPTQEMPLASPCQQLDSISPPTEIATASQLNAQVTVSESQVLPISPPQTPTWELEKRLKNLTKEVVLQSRAAVDARAALDIVRDELRNLGVSPDENADIEQIIAAIGESFRATRIELEGLLPGETPGGFDNSTLLRTLLAHIRKLVNRVEDGERSTFQHSESERALRGNFNAALARITNLESRKTALQSSIERKDTLIQDLRLAASARNAVLANRDAAVADLEAKIADADAKFAGSETRISELQAENTNLETSGARLQAALESYRAEVANLEGVVMQLDEEKKGMARTFAAELKKALEAQAEGLKMAESERARMAHLCETAEEVAEGSCVEMDGITA